MNLHLRRDTDLAEPQRRRQRKGMYLLPALFTAGNIAAGYYAILQTLQGTVADAWHFDNAAKAIGIAILFDGIDGRIARMTHTTSDFGRELDSLADVITFGVAPAVLAWMWGFRWLPTSLDLNGLVDMPASDFRSRLVQLGVIADGRRQPPGPLQHHEEPAAFESGAARQEIFCGHAYSWRSGRGGRDCAFHAWKPGSVVGSFCYLVRAHRGGWISNGEHLALSQLQRY